MLILDRCFYDDAIVKPFDTRLPSKSPAFVRSSGHAGRLATYHPPKLTSPLLSLYVFLRDKLRALGLLGKAPPTTASNGCCSGGVCNIDKNGCGEEKVLLKEKKGVVEERKR